MTAEVIKRCAAGSTNLYEQHIMHALMECGITNAIYSDKYEELFSPKSAHNIIVKPDYAPVEEVIAAVHAAGGIAVLAHPVQYADDTLIERLLPLGLDGIEVWHPSASKEDSDRLFAFCKKNKLLMTGGSDFRGMYNRVPLSPGDYGTPKTQLTELLSFKARQKRLAKKLAAEAAV